MADNYENMSRENLINELKQLKDVRYGIVWDNKVEEFEEKSKNKIPILRDVAENTVFTDDSEPSHLILEGDNYHSLTCLNYTHKGKVDVIYIDPPYNTKNSGFVYNDKLVDDNDKFKHSKWLSFMEKRLKIARELLNEDGIIYISIDDHEMAGLKLLCDKIFDSKNFLAVQIWRGMHTVRNSSNEFNHNTEYILTYAKNMSHLIQKGSNETFLRYPKDKTKDYPYDDNDGNGRYKLDPLHARNFYTPFKYTFNNGYEWEAPEGRYPAFSPTSLKEKDDNGEIVFNGQTLRKATGEEVIYRGKEPQAKRYLKNVQEGVPPNTMLDSEIVGFNKDGTAELAKIFNGEKVFDQPKPTSLIKYLLKIQNANMKQKKNPIILDFFAGSGTTGQAVLELNKEDGIKRQFILCTNNELKPDKRKKLEESGLSLEEIEEQGICRKVTYPRVKRVVTGYEYTGKQEELLYGPIKLTWTQFKKATEHLETIENIKSLYADEYDTISHKVDDGVLKVVGEKKYTGFKEGTGGNIKYFRTDFVGENSVNKADDDDKLILAQNIGDMIAIRENTFTKIEENEWYQIYTNNDRYTCIYFEENTEKLLELKEKIVKLDKETALYIFSWADNEYASDFSDLNNVRIEDIPEPLLKVYKRIHGGA